MFMKNLVSVAALLFSARISSQLALRAAKSLSEEGWTTAEKMAAASWEARTKTLNEAGYARYDERTSAMLGDTAELIIDRYDGDLRNLRQEAEKEPDQERRLLKEFKGIGDVGVDIFFREVQVAWEELFPFSDRRALKSASDLGLPAEPEALLELVGKKDFPQLVAALIRVQQADEVEKVLNEAGVS